MNKTVGVITMHAILNSGSALQAYAICEAIKKLGFHAEIINYRFPNEYHNSLHTKVDLSRNDLNIWFWRLNGLCGRLIGISEKKRIERYREFLQTYVKMSIPYENLEDLQKSPPVYDIYMTGSDQVWNPTYTGNDTAFLLSWVADDKKKISYAASFGSRVFPNEYKERYRSLLSRYNRISVREESNILNELLDYKEIVTLDPTFLLNKDEWRKIISNKSIVKGRYILCYLLRYTFDPYPFASEVIKKVKKATGMKVVMISPEATNILNGYKVLPNCGPIEFLNLFYHASYIITSSFHGTSFAVNFRKDFISIIDDSSAKDNRQISVIKKLGINQSCLVKKNSSLANFVLPRIDYKLCENNINEAVRQSENYLNKALNN